MSVTESAVYKRRWGRGRKDKVVKKKGHGEGRRDGSEGFR